MTVAFYAAGTPKPQGSKRAFVMGGKARLVESGGAQHKDWRATVSQAAHDAMGGAGPMDGPVHVRITFWLQRPKSHPKTRQTWPTQRPDIDKLVRSVLDSMTHVVWKDDSQVIDLDADKRWAYHDTQFGPGVSVTVTPIPTSNT